MIGGVHHIVPVGILPPASAQVTRIARTKLGGAIFNLLESPLERQWILNNECIVVQSLTGDVYHTRSFIATSCRSWDNGQKRDEGYSEKTQRYFERLIQDERLFAVAFCDPGGKLRVKTRTFPQQVNCVHPSLGENSSIIVEAKEGRLHIAKKRIPTAESDPAKGHLLLVHDMSYAVVTSSTPHLVKVGKRRFKRFVLVKE